MDSKLKPCPNPECGGQPNMPTPTVESGWAEATHWVVCPECLMRGPQTSDRQLALMLWNALPRATPDATQPLAVMLAEAVAEAEEANRLKIDPLRARMAEQYVRELLSIIEALPTLSTADKIAMVVIAAPETVAQGKEWGARPNSNELLAALRLTISERCAVGIYQTEGETFFRSGDGWVKLSAPVAAPARQRWEQLAGKGRDKR